MSLVHVVVEVLELQQLPLSLDAPPLLLLLQVLRVVAVGLLLPLAQLAAVVQVVRPTQQAKFLNDLKL